MTEANTRICILGGGFGGLHAALRLSQFDWDAAGGAEILLVDRCDRFVFLPLLYELVSGELESWEIAPPFAELLAGTPVRFCQDEVTSIDAGNRTVRLGSGKTVRFDRLVLALGGDAAVGGVPGAAEWAFPFCSLADADRLRDRLRLLERSGTDPIRVVAIGGGYGGVELTCKLADRLGARGRLRLVDRHKDILRSSSAFNREAARKALSERGVWLDLETQVREVRADGLQVEYKGQTDDLSADLVLWTAGGSAPEVVRGLPLTRGDRDRLQVNDRLQTSDPHIYALGDTAQCCDVSGRGVPSTAQSALQQADYVAWNVWASSNDRPSLPFRYQGLGEMMTLGIDNATLTGLGIELDGPAAHLMRRLAYLYRLPTLEHQVKVGLNWIVKPFREILFGV